VQFEGFVSSGRPYDRHIDARRRGLTLAHDHDIAVLFVLFDAFLRPTRFADPHYEALHRPLLDHLADTDAEVLDLYPHLLDVMAREGAKNLASFWLSVKPLDGHPDSAGHAFIAERIASHLREWHAWREDG